MIWPTFDVVRLVVLKLRPRCMYVGRHLVRVKRSVENDSER